MFLDILFLFLDTLTTSSFFKVVSSSFFISTCSFSSFKVFLTLFFLGFVSFLQLTHTIESNNIVNRNNTIDLSDEETRKIVEKFVEENPEAAASLLRNWLNEDWS